VENRAVLTRIKKSGPEKIFQAPWGELRSVTRSASRAISTGWACKGRGGGEEQNRFQRGGNSGRLLFPRC